MVSSTSAAAQASDNEKRRKQTMERAKAIHVRQLSNAIDLGIQYLVSSPGSCKCDCNMLGSKLNMVGWVAIIYMYWHHGGPLPTPICSSNCLAKTESKRGREPLFPPFPSARTETVSCAIYHCHSYVLCWTVNKPGPILVILQTRCFKSRT